MNQIFHHDHSKIAAKSQKHRSKIAAALQQNRSKIAAKSNHIHIHKSITPAESTCEFLDRTRVSIHLRYDDKNIKIRF